LLNSGDRLKLHGIHHIEIISLIGQGGMANVYKAENRLGYSFSSNIVAIKELDLSRFNPNEHQEIVDNFQRERDVLKEISGSEYFPRYIDYFEENGKYYLVMEYVEGDTLEDLISNNKLDEKQIKEIGLKILDALEVLHKKGIIYRDIKPSNTIINMNGDIKVKLIDLGIARYIKQQLVNNQTGLIDQTKIGTPFFASLEHYAGNCNESSDLYSLAKIFYGYFTKDFKNPILPMAEDIEKLHVSKSMMQFLLKALKLDKRDRFQSVNEMRRALKKVKFDKNNGSVAKNVAPVNANTNVANQPILSQGKCPLWHKGVDLVLLLTIFSSCCTPKSLLLYDDIMVPAAIIAIFLLLSIYGIHRFMDKNRICLFHSITGKLKNLFGKIGSIFGFLFKALSMFLKKVNFGGWKDAVRFWGSYSLPILFLVNWFGWWTIGKVFYFTQVMNWFWIASIGMSVFLIWFAIYRIINDESWSGWAFIILICYWIFGGVAYDVNFGQRYMEKNEFCLATQYEEVESGTKYVDVVNANKQFFVSWNKYHKNDRIFVFYNGNKIEILSSNENKYRGQIKMCLSETTALKFLIVCKERKKIVRSEFVINVRNSKDTLDLTQDNKGENKNQDNIIDLTDKKT